MKLINYIVKGFEATDLDPLPLFNETMQMLSDPNGIYRSQDDDSHMPAGYLSGKCEAQNQL